MCKNIEDIALIADVTIWDHHITNFEKIKELKTVKITFDKNRCGAKIAWDILVGREYPWWLNVIDDRDRWVWLHPFSKELGKYLFSSFNEEIFDEISNWSKDKICNAVAEGKQLCAQDDKAINNMIINALKCTLTVLDRTYRVYITTGYAGLFSETGHILSSRADCDIAAMWKYDLSADEWNISLRSTGDIDVAAVAKQFGGGGHKHAAGFRIDGSKNSIRTVFSF